MGGWRRKLLPFSLEVYVHVKALHKKGNGKLWYILCTFTCLTQIYEALKQTYIAYMYTMTGMAFPNMKKKKTCSCADTNKQTYTLKWAKGS